MELFIIDYAWHGSQTLFVQLKGKDAAGSFEGMVRIVDHLIYGDLVHPKKSALEADTIAWIKEQLESKIQTNYFR